MAEVDVVAPTQPGATWVPAWRRLGNAWAAACTAGELTVTYPDGSRSIFRGRDPGPSAAMVIHRGRAVWRIVARGDLGLAEGYVAGDWSTRDLAAVIEYGIRNEPALARQMRGSLLARIGSALRFRLQANSRAGSRRNIAYHYDLGNDFYAAWLDETMTYSSGLFEPGVTNLADAQRAKYRRIIEALGIGPGCNVLEIGGGWGSFAAFAAKEAGAEVTMLTISREQAAYAQRHLAAQGLAGKVTVHLEDYRDSIGSFDRIVSIEMFEAVGEKNWPGFFDVVRHRLAAGGRGLLQVITLPEERFAVYRQGVDFIQRYIFPGGMLPSIQAMAQAAQGAGLRFKRIGSFGLDYAETLRQWNERFQTEWPSIKPLGFDERFRRMWTYYLNSCEACFRTGATDVGHFLLER